MAEGKDYLSKSRGRFTVVWSFHCFTRKRGESFRHNVHESRNLLFRARLYYTVWERPDLRARARRQIPGRRQQTYQPPNEGNLCFERASASLRLVQESGVNVHSTERVRVDVHGAHVFLISRVDRDSRPISCTLPFNVHLLQQIYGTLKPPNRPEYGIEM